MKLLKNERDFKRFAKAFGMLETCERPKQYPCFAYDITTSYGMEESDARYIYAEDLQRMKKQIDHIQRAAKLRQSQT